MNNETDKISEERIAVRIDRKSDLYFGIVLVVVGLVAAVFTAIRKNNWLAFAADVVIVALGAFQAVRWFVGRKRPATLISVRGCDLVYFDEKTRGMNTRPLKDVRAADVSSADRGGRTVLLYFSDGKTEVRYVRNARQAVSRLRELLLSTGCEKKGEENERKNF